MRPTHEEVDEVVLRLKAARTPYNLKHDRLQAFAPGEIPPVDWLKTSN